MANLPPNVRSYNEDAADEAAAALLWLTAQQESVDQPWTVARQVPQLVLRRLEMRGWVAQEPGAQRLRLTPEGRSRCEQFFTQLFGEAKPATLPRRLEPHVVQEEDGE